ncbi:MAG: threonylcarbamoyl-AMP synthase [Deltaproteobacteria bacterium]|nr:threonylcarbamoyl-AMP synthase [Candidatus Anaeroferrophillus wilburensis]MBN2890024.1 threonylcarbamoyl-AMP synthase [Deltaproteobacteria bacterium]
MLTVLSLYDDVPKDRLLNQVVDQLSDGGLAIVPTDTNYAAVCSIDARQGVQRLYALKTGKKQKQFTLVCADLTDISRYAVVSKQAYRCMKGLIPGPYTFILPASRQVPKMVMTKRRTVGVRVPDRPACQALLAGLGSALLAVSARDDQGQVVGSVAGLVDRFSHVVDYLLDAGDIVSESSTIIDLTTTAPEIIREGKGQVDYL